MHSQPPIYRQGDSQTTSDSPEGRERRGEKGTLSLKDVSFQGSSPLSKSQSYDSVLHFWDLGTLASTPCISHAVS